MSSEGILSCNNLTIKVGVPALNLDMEPVGTVAHYTPGFPEFTQILQFILIWAFLETLVVSPTKLTPPPFRTLQSQSKKYLYFYTDNMCHVFRHLAIDCCLVSPSSAADPEIFPRGVGGVKGK